MLKVGQVLNNYELMNEFKCSNTGGMRRSKRTNSLVLILDHTKLTYRDKWKDHILYYTGMGLKGDQRLDFMQNKTLYGSRENGVQIHLFEVFQPKEYTYKGEVYLSDEPFQEEQEDVNGQKRKVWMFPLKLKG